jgi:hypothetical protein
MELYLLQNGFEHVVLLTILVHMATNHKILNLTSILLNILIVRQ